VTESAAVSVLHKSRQYGSSMYPSDDNHPAILELQQQLRKVVSVATSHVKVEPDDSAALPTIDKGKGKAVFIDLTLDDD
jgi:hypothetical protein